MQLKFVKVASFATCVTLLIDQFGLVEPDYDLISALEARLLELYYEKKAFESKDFKKDV